MHAGFDFVKRPFLLLLSAHVAGAPAALLESNSRLHLIFSTQHYPQDQNRACSLHTMLCHGIFWESGGSRLSNNGLQKHHTKSIFRRFTLVQSELNAHKRFDTGLLFLSVPSILQNMYNLVLPRSPETIVLPLTPFPNHFVTCCCWYFLTYSCTSLLIFGLLIALSLLL